MNLREKVLKLLEVPGLPAEECKALAFVVRTYPEGDLEDLMFPAVRAHMEGHFEWYYRSDGQLRRKAA